MTTATQPKSMRARAAAAIAAGAQANCYRIIGTAHTIYAAVEPSRSIHALDLPQHSRITTVNGVHSGYITSRPLPDDINAIPVGPARSAAVQAWRRELQSEAITVILHFYPHLNNFSGTINFADGEVETWGE